MVTNSLPRAVLFSGALMGAHARTSQLGISAVQGHREAWQSTLSAPVLENGQSAFGSVVEDSFDASRSLSSLLKIDDGVISISVPEPGTMGTLATGLAMIVCLMGHKRRKFMTITKPFLH